MAGAPRGGPPGDNTLTDDAVAALDRGGVLAALREAGAGRVWEPGGGALGERLTCALGDAVVAATASTPQALEAEGAGAAGKLVALLCGPGLDADSAAACAAHACSLGCPYLYLAVEGEPPDELRRWYWLHEVRPADPRVPSLRELLAADDDAALAAASRYRHWIGWRRVMPA